MSKYALVMLALLLCFGLTSCGSSGGAGSNGSNRPAPTYPEKSYTYDIKPESDTDATTAAENNNLFYVDQARGNDQNNGSSSAPWKTIQKAADTLQAGQMVYVRAGVYNERVRVKSSGTAGNYIVFSAYPQERVIIDGTGIAPPNASSPRWGGLFLIDHNTGYIKVKGFTVRNSVIAGIFAEQSNNVIIQANYIYNTGSSGVGVWSTPYATVDGNELVASSNSGSSTSQECLTVAAMCTDFRIMNNKVHHNGVSIPSGCAGIDAKGSPSGIICGNTVHDLPEDMGIYVDAWDITTQSIEVFNNTVYNCNPEGIGLTAEAGGKLKNVKVYNNLVYNNGAVGIIVVGVKGWGNPNTNHYLEDIYVYNNTIYNNQSQAIWGYGVEVKAPQGKNIYVYNNILYKNGHSDTINVPTKYSDGTTMAQPGNLQINNNLQGKDPYLRWVNEHFLLSQNSTLAIDKALGPNNDSSKYPYLPSIDRLWIKRPQGSGADLGAYEYQ